MPPLLRESLQQACDGAYKACCEDDTSAVEVFVQWIVEAAS
jgi:hypothetical protein